MGKKATMSRDSMKIAKKQQAATTCRSSSLMSKALRPRVYITDVADFKRLVQELTGNNDVPLPQPIPDNAAHLSCLPQPIPDNAAHLSCLPQLPQETVTTITVVENSDPILRSGETRIWDDFEGVLQREDALSKCFSGELPGLESLWHLQQTQPYEKQMDNNALLTFGDIEGWLLDIDSSPSWESYVLPDPSTCDFITGGTFDS